MDALLYRGAAFGTTVRSKGLQAAGAAGGLRWVRGPYRLPRAGVQVAHQLRRDLRVDRRRATRATWTTGLAPRAANNRGRGWLPPDGFRSRA